MPNGEDGVVVSPVRGQSRQGRSQAWPEYAGAEQVEIGELIQRDGSRLPPSETIQEAARRMRADRLAEIFVVAGDDYLGTVTERDILAVVAEGVAPETPVSELLSEIPIHEPVARPDQTASEILRLLEAGGRLAGRPDHRIPVTREGRMLGVVPVGAMRAARDGLPVEPATGDRGSGRQAGGKRRRRPGGEGPGGEVPRATLHDVSGPTMGRPRPI